MDINDKIPLLNEGVYETDYEPRINFLINVVDEINIVEIEKTLEEEELYKIDPKYLSKLFYHILELFSYYINNCDKDTISYMYRELKFLNFLDNLIRKEVLKVLKINEIVLNYNNISNSKLHYVHKYLKSNLLNLLKYNNFLEYNVLKFKKK